MVQCEFEERVNVQLSQSLFTIDSTVKKVSCTFDTVFFTGFLVSRHLKSSVLDVSQQGRIYSLLIMYNYGLYTRWRPPQ